MPDKKNQKPAMFALGDTVRVRSGVTDPDFPDTPLGGWSGEITDVEEGDPPLYLIRWSKETLSQLHPIYRKRCERDGLDFEEMRLEEQDIESASGGPVTIEQPTAIVTPPLSIDDQDDRVRSVFGLTRDEPLPLVDEASLHIYYKYLAAHLTFPFEAKWEQEADFGEVAEQVTALGLGGSEEEPLIDDMQGILCNAKLRQGHGELPLAELTRLKKPNNQLVEDYAYWFWDNR